MLRHPLKSILALGVLALGSLAIVQTASAGDEGCYRDCAPRYCDRDCYRSALRYDRDYDNRYDRGYEDRDGYRDSDWSGRGLRYVCDSDGDRCYASESRYWDYREYYRRHGYHWQY
ncbi:MAG: hypothetical protein P4L57_04060 [Rhizomicrobium sp.]|nr:hypothetical protein [Rhizomicrobium sp.]